MEIDELAVEDELVHSNSSWNLTHSRCFRNPRSCETLGAAKPQLEDEGEL